ncbi:hypothetical protein MBLNU230_g2660t1 [Neophaeotheca triangularis]
MDAHDTTTRQAPPTPNQAMDHAEEMLADVDEPPDDRGYFTWGHTRIHRYESHSAAYAKSQLPPYARRESLLTRQLHSENEHTEDEAHVRPPRGLSTVSTWSNPSTTSTAELTSDDGKSVASPAISPPPSVTHFRNMLDSHNNPITEEPAVVEGQDDAPMNVKVEEKKPEQSVEAGLGRKRCITFACGGKKEAKVVTPPVVEETPEEKPTSPPKRKCAIKFVCPTRAGAENNATLDKAQPQLRRPASPAPTCKKRSSSKTHRGSDSTVTHASPKNIRKSSQPPNTDVTSAPRKLSNDSDDSGPEATRFHEFGTSEEEPEEWVQEATCHRSRLTITDTLRKENAIRKLAEEDEEEEALLEEDLDEGLDLDDDNDDDDDEDADDQDGEEDTIDVAQDDAEEEDSDSDDGFKSDDEGGFAESDSSGDESDFEWWRPGGAPSTAATSHENMNEHLITPKLKADRMMSESSVGSASSAHLSPRSSRQKFHGRPRKRTVTAAVPIVRPELPDLPDSTDFVCGTLDEDKPLEVAYVSCKKEREAAKHSARPQDIDPTFPTSDPEMDEEDDEDIEDPEESESDAEKQAMVHGSMEELDEPSPPQTMVRRPSPHHAKRSNQRSPPPPQTSRHRSPPPPQTSRHRSPPPPQTSRHRSPPPPTRHRSPPPPNKRRSIAHSPPPPTTTNTTRQKALAHSPPPQPRKLFARDQSSPPPNSRRQTSPINAPQHRLTSPPNTRRASPTSTNTAMVGLAGRPQLTHTASLPRGGLSTLLRQHHLRQTGGHHHHSHHTSANSSDAPKRGAIDIVKGLENKRQRRKEKLYQKHCAKAAERGGRHHHHHHGGGGGQAAGAEGVAAGGGGGRGYRVKPGKGAERMREIGWRLGGYHGNLGGGVQGGGKGGHILSV